MIFAQDYTKEPPGTVVASTTPWMTAESQTEDKESDNVGSDLDGMKALFNATLSE
jgi:hypothetical protein